MGQRSGGRLAVIAWLVGIIGWALAPGVGSASLVISEIMYHSSPANAEWFEVYNPGTTTVSLAGWVFDDGSPSVLNSPNIAGGSVPPGGVAVLYNSAVTESVFRATWNNRPGHSNWGSQINLIPVTSWSVLNNTTTDSILLWTDHASFKNGEIPDIGIGYTANSPAFRSRYLKEYAEDWSSSRLWATSEASVDSAYLSTNDEAGTPGFVTFPVPEPASFGGIGLLAALRILTRLRRAGAAVAAA